jgi:hypothetical protein
MSAVSLMSCGTSALPPNTHRDSPRADIIALAWFRSCGSAMTHTTRADVGSHAETAIIWLASKSPLQSLRRSLQD